MLGRDHVIARPKQRQHGIDRGHTRGKCQAVLRFLQARHALFQSGARWVALREYS